MITLNYRDSRPIYEQIKESIRKQIIAGSMKKDEKLQSVRDMASEMAINPNTIQRAYRELETEGYIYSVAGRGSFVAEVKEVDMKRIKDLQIKLEEIIQELIYTGVKREELVSLIYEVYSKEGNDV